jgi:hypothetical protein
VTQAPVERPLHNTRLALLLTRVFAVLIASLFALYGYSWFASQQHIIATLIALSALFAFAVAFLPSRVLDGLVHRTLTLVGL